MKLQSTIAVTEKGEKMPKYIDADVARRIIDSPRSKEQMLLVLSQAEPADVVEVVRCEDCKHNDTAKCPSRLHDNGFFCAQGERREDGKIH